MYRLDLGLLFWLRGFNFRLSILLSALERFLFIFIVHHITVGMLNLLEFYGLCFSSLIFKLEVFDLSEQLLYFFLLVLPPVDQTDNSDNKNPNCNQHQPEIVILDSVCYVNLQLLNLSAGLIKWFV